MGSDTGDLPDRCDYGPNILEEFLEEDKPGYALWLHLCKKDKEHRMTAVTEAAKILGIPYATIRNQVSRGVIDVERRTFRNHNQKRWRANYVDLKQVREYNNLTLKEKIAWRRNRADPDT